MEGRIKMNLFILTCIGEFILGSIFLYSYCVTEAPMALFVTGFAYGLGFAMLTMLLC